MTTEIKTLKDSGLPLPQGTRIKTTHGGMHTGGTHELPASTLESANRIREDGNPFWITGWADLHDQLTIPNNPVT